MSVFRSVSKCVLPSVHRASSVPAALMGGAAIGTHRISVSITGLTDGASKPASWPSSSYPIKVTIGKQSEMSSDYSDIRMIDTDESTLLPYWIEQYDGSNVTLWVSVPLASGSTTRTIYCYYGVSGASLSDGTSVFPFFDGFGDGTNRDGNSPASGAFTATLPGITNERNIISPAYNIREQSNILKTGGFYYMTVTSNDNIYLWRSTTMEGTWTDLGVICLLGEDAYIVTNGTTWFLYAEDKRGDQTGIGLWTAATIEGPWTYYGTVIAKGAGGSYDAFFSQSPTAYFDGTSFHMLYESAATSNSFTTSYASSSDGYTWTKGGSNPVALSMQVVDDYKTIGGTTYYLSHDGGGSMFLHSGPAPGSGWVTAGALLPIAAFGLTGVSMQFVPDSDDTVSGQRIVNGPITLYDWASSWWGGQSDWSFGSLQLTGTTAKAARGFLDDGEMWLTGRNSLNANASAYIATVSNEVFDQCRIVVGNSASFLDVSSFFISIGTGSVVSKDGNAPQFPTFQNGYLIGNAGTSRMFKITGGNQTSTLASATTPANPANAGTWEAWVGPSGALAFARNGTSVVSATDTTFAPPQKFMIAKAGANVAKLSWVFVTPRASTEPSSSNGSPMEV